MTGAPVDAGVRDQPSTAVIAELPAVAVLVGQRREPQQAVVLVGLNINNKSWSMGARRSMGWFLPLVVVKSR